MANLSLFLHLLPSQVLRVRRAPVHGRGGARPGPAARRLDGAVQPAHVEGGLRAPRGARGARGRQGLGTALPAAVGGRLRPVAGGGVAAAGGDDARPGAREAAR